MSDSGYHPESTARHATSSRVSDGGNEPAEHADHAPTGSEVLAHLGFGPAFPGILIGPDLAEVAMAMPGCRVEQPLLVSPAMARWIGILLEARYGSAQMKFSWHADVGGLPVLAIEDDPWDERPHLQPRLVYPDEQGRYALKDCWVALTTEQAAEWMADHAAVLDLMATTEPEPNTPVQVTDYLQLMQAHHLFDPDRHIRGIRRALADYPDRKSPDPIVDVVADPGTDSTPSVTIFLNGRPVATDRYIILDVDTSATPTDPNALFNTIGQATTTLTPPAAALARALLEQRLSAAPPSWSPSVPPAESADEPPY